MFLTHRLNAIKEAKQKIDEKLRTTGRNLGDQAELSQAGQVGKRLRERSAAYGTEIKTTRQLRDDSAKFDLTTKGSIIKTWNQLRAVRENQGFASTPHIIKFHREAPDAAAETAALAGDVQEMLAEEEADYDGAMESKRWEYREQHAHDVARGVVEHSDELPSELAAPFDANSARVRIRTHCLECRRPPGVPNLDSLLQFGGMTPVGELSALAHGHTEALRRERITQYTLGIDILVNRQRVHRTTGKMEPNFIVRLQDAVHLHLDETPREIAFVFWEDAKRPLAEINVPIPESSANAAGYDAGPTAAPENLKSVMFSCDRNIRKVAVGDAFVSSDSHPGLYCGDEDGVGVNEEFRINKAVMLT